MAGIRISKLHKQFADGTVAVRELDLDIHDGELLVMLGPSGCGKTTTLRCIAGLEQQTGGDISIGDRLVNSLRPGERDIAMVFQFYALYPHFSVRDNIAFPLRAEGADAKTIEQAVQQVAQMLKISDLLGRKPNRLSGGEQQRVALGRAMVRKPQAFLMDEPLTNLDPELRGDMRVELKHLQVELRTTMVYVTHDQVEAMSLADRIAIMNEGELEQVGTPLEVYRQPATLFVAGFIGSPPMSLLPAEVVDGGLHAAGALRLPAPDGLRRGQKVVAGVRPEGFRLVAPDEDGALASRVLSREALGDETIYVVEVGEQRLHVRMDPASPFREDDAVGIVFEGESPPNVFDPDSGRAVGTLVAGAP